MFLFIFIQQKSAAVAAPIPGLVQILKITYWIKSILRKIESIDE